MVKKGILTPRITGLCGILAPVIALTCIGLAILFAPWFSWTHNYLSDLGGSPESESMWAAHGISSILFNSGLIVAGVLGICFAVGIKKSGILESNPGNIGVSFCFLDGCALIGVGVFTETAGAAHTVFSIAFFILVGLTLLFMGIALIRSSEKNLGWLTMVLFIFGLMAVPLIFMPKPVGSNAVMEMIPIISISLFTVIFGYRLLRISSEEEDKKNRKQG